MTAPVTPTPEPNLAAPRASIIDPTSTLPETPSPPTTVSAPVVEDVDWVLPAILNVPEAIIELMLQFQKLLM